MLANQLKDPLHLVSEHISFYYCVCIVCHCIDTIVPMVIVVSQNKICLVWVYKNQKNALIWSVFETIEVCRCSIEGVSVN